MGFAFHVFEGSPLRVCGKQIVTALDVAPAQGAREEQIT